MIGVQEITSLLTAPASTEVADSRREELRNTVSTRLCALIARGSQRPPVVLTLRDLRRFRLRPGSLGDPEPPFQWRPVFVRRSLGLAMVGACASGRFRSPAEAAGPVAEEALSRWSQTGWRTFHWEPWLNALPLGARAVVLAEAVTWATSLWTSLDWPSLAAPGSSLQVGGADDVWSCPTQGNAVRFKGRGDLRVGIAGRPAPGPAEQASRPASALVVVSGGTPSLGWEEDLAFPALVTALRPPSRPVPARVVGLWPDAGTARVLEVDVAVLSRAADLAVEAVGALAASTGGQATGIGHDSGQNRPRAARVSGFPAAVSGSSSTTASSRGSL